MPVDLDRIKKSKLDIISVDEQIDRFIKEEREKFLSDTKSKLALRYLIIEAVEAIVDICQHILAKVKGIPCEGYVDCIIKAGKAGIISKLLSENLRRLADLRNIIVHRYWILDDQKIYDQALNSRKDLSEFVEQIEIFLSKLNE